MGALVVVEVQEALEGSVQGREGGEEAAAEGDSPVFVKDGALETFDEAVGPAVTRFGASVMDGELRADVIKEASELISLVREDAAKLPPGPSIGGQQDVFEESRAVDGFGRGDDLGHGIGAGGVARCDLPELTHTFESANVETIQADQLAGDVRFDVAGLSISSSPEGSTGALGKQASCPSAVVFDDGQPLMTGREPHTSKKTVDCAGGHGHLAARELVGQTPRSPGRPRQGHAENGMFLVSLQLGRPPGPAPPPARVQALGPILSQLLLPSVEQRSRDPQVPADLAGVSKLDSSVQRPKTKSLYSLLEGHRPASLSSFAEEQTLGRLGPLTLVSSPANRLHEVSTPLWDSSV